MGKKHTPHQVTGNEGKDERAAEEAEDSRVSIVKPANFIGIAAGPDAQHARSGPWTHVWLSPFGLRNHAAVEKAMIIIRPMTKLQLLNFALATVTYNPHRAKGREVEA